MFSQTHMLTLRFLLCSVLEKKSPVQIVPPSGCFKRLPRESIVAICNLQEVIIMSLCQYQKLTRIPPFTLSLNWQSTRSHKITLYHNRYLTRIHPITLCHNRYLTRIPPITLRHNRYLTRIPPITLCHNRYLTRIPPITLCRNRY